MKKVDLDNNTFKYEGKEVSHLSMGNGKHIRFTAIDKNYDLNVIDPDGDKTDFPVPKDGEYHKFEIKGKKDQTYTFKMKQENNPRVTVPQMIVKVS